MLHDNKYDKLANELQKIANEMVGKIGPSTDCALSITNEKYKHLFLGAKNQNELIEKWREAIALYLKFNKTLGSNDKKHRIYWRTLPNIGKEDGLIKVSSRFLISSQNPLINIDDSQ